MDGGKSFNEVAADVAQAQKPKKKYGEPGSLMKASDGTVYEVQKDGSWRRIKSV